MKAKFSLKKEKITFAQLIRFARYTDCDKDFEEAKIFLYNKLLGRDFPREVTDKEFEKIKGCNRAELRQLAITKVLLKRQNAKFPFSSTLYPQPTKISIPLINKYDPRICRMMKRIRRDLEESLNAAARETGSHLKKIRIVNAFSIGKRLGHELDKKIVRCNNNNHP